MNDIERSLDFYENGPAQKEILLFGGNSEVEDTLLRQGRCRVLVFDDDIHAVTLASDLAGSWEDGFQRVLAESHHHFWVTCGVASRPMARAKAIRHITEQLSRCQNWAWFGPKSETAIISKYAKVDPTAMILDGALVMGATEIGRHAVLLPGARLYHYSTVGAGAILVGGCTVLGRVKVGDRAWICGGAVVVPGSVIEPGGIVPAGTTFRPLKREID